MAKRTRSLKARLARRLRRDLAATLLVGGSSLVGMTATTNAHDHADTAAGSIAGSIAADTAHDVLPARLTDEAMLDRWLSQADATPQTCLTDAADGRADGVTVAAGDGANQQSRRLARDLADLSCEEPIDVEQPLVAARDSANAATVPASEFRSPATIAGPDQSSAAAGEGPRYRAAGFVGSSAVIASLGEGYLAYDLSPEDAIAMRMYPLPGLGPDGGGFSGRYDFDFAAGRRTADSRPPAVGGARGGVFGWNQVTHQGRVISVPSLSIVGSTRVPADVAPGATLVEGHQAVVAAEPAGEIGEVAVVEESLRVAVSDALAGLRSDGGLAVSLHPERVGWLMGDWTGRGIEAADAAVVDLANRLATARPAAVGPVEPAQPENVESEASYLGESRLAEARLEVPTPAPRATVLGVSIPADVGATSVSALPASSRIGSTIGWPEPSLRDATVLNAGIVDGAFDLGGPAVRLPQLDLACQAAIDVVLKQASRSSAAPTAIAAGSTKRVIEPQRPDPNDPLMRAVAVATACDQAAATLEQLALALRRAGDSLIRQAKAGTPAKDSLLR